MSDSDSDSGYDWPASRHRSNLGNDTVIALRPSEEIFDRWLSIPIDKKREAGQRMKVCTFWLPILLQQKEVNHTSEWALQIGLIDSLDSEDLSLNNIHMVEILEAILRALERGSVKREHTKHIFWLSNMFNLRSPEAWDDVFLWLERTGEPNICQRVLELGHKQACVSALHLIFTEFAKYIQDMGGNMERTMKSLLAQPPPYYIEKSEDMKKKGNENFQKSQYEDAVKFYSTALKYYPDNHIIYGNRALCYIRCRKYLKAVGDGKRAVLIKPLWAKGHYRYCEALFSLGEIRKAIEANKLAQSLCGDDHDGVKDLEQQHQKFITEMRELKVGKSKNKIRRPDGTRRADAAESPVKMDMKTSKVFEVKKDKQPGKNEPAAPMKSSTKDSKPSKSEVHTKNVKVEPGTTAQKKSMNRNCQSGEENQAVGGESADVCKELRSLVQDAHTALTDLRSRNAEQAFSKALTILETKTLKVLGLSTVDMLLLLYGRAAALTEIGQPEELSEAKKLVQKISSFEERTFQCLVHYAIGKLLLKENRFAVALQQFSDSLQMVKNQITPGKLTWPLTKEIVKETLPEYLMVILENAIELCKFPPVPDAVCRFEKGHSSLKAEIYITDPDFKGYIQICCCQSCTVEYHITCWKTLKASNFSERNEKDLLHEACLTPDCLGQICSIRIISPTGLLKCKFDVAIPKSCIPQKPKVNQKCTSLKKLQSKMGHKLKRKQNRLSFEGNQTINDEILQQTEDTATKSQQKAWLLYRDRVLLQISQKMDLLKEEKGLQVSVLVSNLKPWLELDSLKGNKLAERMLNWQQQPLETLGQALELLLERQNRVWARVLIQILSSLDVNPKLNKWACQLNDAGLNAATSFIERYAGHLEQMDLGLLLSFGPLQERILMKLGSMPEIFSSIGLTVTEYLKQAPPHDIRLFIWTLEEHRDDYVACHTILDEYFDMMDGHCSVLKKSDENENNSPTKTKNRKKKLNATKGLYSFPQTRDVTPRDEWDHDLFEDDSLLFLHPGDPFSVPSHLREQVADFEEQYNGTSQPVCYKKILDNHPDPTKESLYDYFAQILEEHGPLVAEDPLLVGELEYFPSEAQLKIEESGGFESFLLESLRFIKIGNCVGLAKHAVSLQQAGLGASLDDLDVIVDPDAHRQTPDFHEPAFPNQRDMVSSAQPPVFPSFSNPFSFSFHSGSEVDPSAVIFKGKDLLTQWSNAYDRPQQFPYFSFKDVGERELCDYKPDRIFGVESSGVTSSSWTPENDLLRKDAAVQTFPETMSSVAVNTEPHERFERYQGDINKKEKGNVRLEKQIKGMTSSSNKVVQKHKEEMASIEEEIRNINTKTQMTNRELTLFQHKLEEEVKKDQKEKKANQEVLRSIKQEMDELVEEHGRLARNIRDNKANYDKQLRDFREKSNQAAAEKMSLEDEIRRCKDSIVSVTRRSHTAQVLVAESSREQGLHSLYHELAEAKAFLSRLNEAMHRHPDPAVDIIRGSWRSKVQEIEKKISTAEAHYKEQIDQVKNGGRVGEGLLGNANGRSEASGPTVAGAAKDLSPQPSASITQQTAAAAAVATAPASASAPARSQHKPPATKQEPPHNTLYEKIIDRLLVIFPDYTRLDMLRRIQDLRLSSGGSFRSMELQDVVGGVTQMILDHQEKLSSVRSNIVRRGNAAGTPPPVWQPIENHRHVHPDAINVEDPCIICHEDMSPQDICVLECRHSFHENCIRSWLKEQSTCPTCRDHALMPDDFPALSSRRRPAP
ncbi:E3 ubiquitin-protein ligase TTC3 [Solea solea]|uniref:E3 ubiquitin-protein ligase TTC3 n=1 Tax=Solea solea TaxID=90069 RepID=UPI0027296544|nr:E3 ubiquitin-protein ligase TTC3 [Solea solea]